MAPQGEIREIAGELPLSHNAQVVLKKRYLKKDEAGETTEAAPDMFRRVADTIAAIDRHLRSPGGRGRHRPKVLRPHGVAQVHAQLPHPDERRPGAGPALRLLRPAGGRQHREHLRSGETNRPHPQVRRRHRVFLLPHPARQRPGALHQGGGLRPHLLHEHLRRGHRNHQAGRHPPGRQHGHPPGGPPGYRSLHHL